MFSQISVELGEYVFLSGALFILGLLGFLLRRNLFSVLLSLEVLLTSIYLMLITFSHFLNDEKGTIILLILLPIMLFKTIVGLSLYRQFKSPIGKIDVGDFDKLKG